MLVTHEFISLTVLINLQNRYYHVFVNNMHPMDIHQIVIIIKPRVIKNVIFQKNDLPGSVRH